ncbi:uroporphyrinogen decarboxylase family protein [Paludibaculum fermentans]|uniref:uroporphyrinogen decarboxylase family protein n=1 Tax=Paludibaculum fermentans TaxID=1473598 RepID=UPI003EB9DACD
MTPRERLLATLHGETADRVPVSPFIQEQYLSWYYPDRPTVDRVTDAVELANELDFDLMAKHNRFQRPHFLRRSYPNWQLASSREFDGRIIRYRTTIATPHRTLVQEEAVEEIGAATIGAMRVTTKHLLETREDVEAFLEYLPPLDDEERRVMRQTVAGWQALLGDRGVLAPWGFAGVFNFAADLRGSETLFMEPIEDETSYRGLMDRMADAQSEYCQALVEAGADCVGIQGHIANAGTVSSAFFREYIQEYEKRLIDAIHSAGAFTVFHNCGRARRLYPNYRELGMTLWETISEPPAGDNNLAQAKAELGDTICLLGNLDQIHFLKTATPTEVADRTRQVMSIGKPGGRYIFAASDFLEPGTPRENVVAMLEAARDSGGY